MKLTTDLEKKFSAQITSELNAAVAYRQLAIEAECLSLSGMAAWLRIQSDEEVAHADRFIAHVVDRGNRPVIGAIKATGLAQGMTALQIFEAALDNEEQVSAAIRDLYRAAQDAGDLDSRPVLDWFLSEQIDEEASVGEIVEQLKLVGADGSGLLRLDRELGARQPTGPAPV